MLNATTGTDPQDIFTVTADADHKRPANWKEALDTNALKGKKIDISRHPSSLAMRMMIPDKS
ncbi:hypothetical protein ACFSQ7_40540 [Paenibacillus rhizoplanae]